MADEIIIRKLSNGNVQVERIGAVTPTSLSANSDIEPISGDRLYVKSAGGKQDEFTVESVEKVVRESGTEVAINDITTLYSELSTYFFFKAPAGGGSGGVNSVNGDVGPDVILTTSEISEDANYNYVTDSEKTVLGNTSNTNTGDETTGSIQSKRPLKTVDGQSLEGAGDIPIGGIDSVNGDTGPNVNLDSSDIPDVSDYGIGGNIDDTINKITNGGEEIFPISAIEGVSNLNNGQFFSVLKFMRAGTYNTIRFYTRNLNLSPAQSYQLRASVHDFSLTSSYGKGSLLLSDTTDDIHDISLGDFNLDSNYYYVVLGANNNVGGGTISSLRQTANGLNSPTLAFNFTQLTGDIPEDIASLTQSQTNTIFYTLTYK